jgi:hypothetical protein
VGADDKQLPIAFKPDGGSGWARRRRLAWMAALVDRINSGFLE